MLLPVSVARAARAFKHLLHAFASESNHGAVNRMEDAVAAVGEGESCLRADQNSFAKAQVHV